MTDAEREKAIATVAGLLMSARASTEAALKLLDQLQAPALPRASEDPGICEHPAEHRKAVTTMGDGPPQEVCGACGRTL